MKTKKFVEIKDGTHFHQIGANVIKYIKLAQKNKDGRFQSYIRKIGDVDIPFNAIDYNGNAILCDSNTTYEIE